MTFCQRTIEKAAANRFLVNSRKRRRKTGPRARSFREFLERHASVRSEDGTYRKYSFKGREALMGIVSTIDLVLGSGGRGEGRRSRGRTGSGTLPSLAGGTPGATGVGQAPGATLSDATIAICGGAQFGKS